MRRSRSGHGERDGSSQDAPPAPSDLSGTFYFPPDPPLSRHSSLPSTQNYHLQDCLPYSRGYTGPTYQPPQTFTLPLAAPCPAPPSSTGEFAQPPPLLDFGGGAQDHPGPSYLSTETLSHASPPHSSAPFTMPSTSTTTSHSYFLHDLASTFHGHAPFDAHSLSLDGGGGVYIPSDVPYPSYESQDLRGSGLQPMLDPLQGGGGGGGGSGGGGVDVNGPYHLPSPHNTASQTPQGHHPQPPQMEQGGGFGSLPKVQLRGQHLHTHSVDVPILHAPTVVRRPHAQHASSSVPPSSSSTAAAAGGSGGGEGGGGGGGGGLQQGHHPPVGSPRLQLAPQVAPHPHMSGHMQRVARAYGNLGIALDGEGRVVCPYCQRVPCSHRCLMARVMDSVRSDVAFLEEEEKRQNEAVNHATMMDNFQRFCDSSYLTPEVDRGKLFQDFVESYELVPRLLSLTPWLQEQGRVYAATPGKEMHMPPDRLEIRCERAVALFSRLELTRLNEEDAVILHNIIESCGAPEAFDPEMRTKIQCMMDLVTVVHACLVARKRRRAATKGQGLALTPTPRELPEDPPGPRRCRGKTQSGSRCKLTAASATKLHGRCADAAIPLTHGANYCKFHEGQELL